MLAQADRLDVPRFTGVQLLHLIARTAKNFRMTAFSVATKARLREAVACENELIE